MPVNPKYPGVYIEEIPSGVRTITGVPTSITTFIGRAKKENLMILSWSGALPTTSGSSVGFVKTAR